MLTKAQRNFDAGNVDANGNPIPPAQQPAAQTQSMPGGNGKQPVAANG